MSYFNEWFPDIRTPIIVVSVSRTTLEQFLNWYVLHGMTMKHIADKVLSQGLQLREE